MDLRVLLCNRKTWQRYEVDTIKNKSQTFHDQDDHWIAASNMSSVAAAGEVVFDSVYNTIDKLTEDAIIRKFGKDADTTDRTTANKLMKFQ